jgi:hypothetical protein
MQIYSESTSISRFSVAGRFNRLSNNLTAIFNWFMAIGPSFWVAKDKPQIKGRQAAISMHQHCFADLSQNHKAKYRRWFHRPKSLRFASTNAEVGSSAYRIHESWQVQQQSELKWGIRAATGSIQLFKITNWR